MQKDHLVDLLPAVLHLVIASIFFHLHSVDILTELHLKCYFVLFSQIQKETNKNKQNDVSMSLT